MNKPSASELRHVRQAAGLSTSPAPGDYVVEWFSSFGVILIEVRGEQVFVNGEPVQPADGAKGLGYDSHIKSVDGELNAILQRDATSR